MEIVIDFKKSAQENAKTYFEMSKKSKLKSEGAVKSVEDLKEKLKNLENQKEKSKVVKEIEKREWYEKYNWFFTSNNLLVIGGRSADQNEEIYSKHLDNNDLFFHADVFGASVVVLKEGINTDKNIRDEVAQFSASFSKAWESGQGNIDVYCVKKDQVTKSKNYGSLGKGSFVILGDREWYKNVRLALSAFIKEIEIEGKIIKKFSIVPRISIEKIDIKQYVSIDIGNSKKSDAAKKISAKLKYDNIDYIMQHLPPGSFSIN
ncbi:MAG: NFACT RNA binding domain-containing protein [Candidatus Micrarchaeaceae archaeon]